MSDDRKTDTIERLEHLRDDLRGAMDAAILAGAGTVAQISAQYRATLAELLALSPPAESGPKSKLDELKERRERNHAPGSAGPPTPTAAVVAAPRGRKRGA